MEISGFFKVLSRCAKKILRFVWKLTGGLINLSLLFSLTNPYYRFNITRVESSGVESSEVRSSKIYSRKDFH